MEFKTTNDNSFNTTSLQHDLFNTSKIADTGQWNFTAEFSLPPCEYDGVKDYPYIIERQFIVGSKISKYLGVPFVWPDRVYFDELPENTHGEAMMNGKKKIKYSHSVEHDYWLQTIVPGHEIVHLHEVGIDELLRMHSTYTVLDNGKVYFITIPTGRILTEGGTEVLLTKIDEPRDSYESWFQVMYEIDKLNTSVKDLYTTAQVYGSDSVWNKLSSSGAMESIDDYVLRELKESGLEQPIILARHDFSIGYK